MYTDTMWAHLHGHNINQYVLENEMAVAMRGTAVCVTGVLPLSLHIEELSFSGTKATKEWSSASHFPVVDSS